MKSFQLQKKNIEELINKLQKGFDTDDFSTIAYKIFVLPFIIIFYILLAGYSMIFDFILNFFNKLVDAPNRNLLGSNETNGIKSSNTGYAETAGGSANTDTTVKYLYSTDTVIFEEKDEEISLSEELNISRNEYDNATYRNGLIAGLMGIGSNMYAEYTTINPDEIGKDIPIPQTRVRPQQFNIKTPDIIQPISPQVNNDNNPMLEKRAIRQTTNFKEFTTPEKETPQIQKEDIAELRNKLLNPKNSGGSGRVMKRE